MLPVLQVSSPLALHAHRAVVIFNPTAGKGRRKRLEKVLTYLSASDLVPRLLETGRAGDAEAMARELELTHEHLLLVAGGDGTINEAINGLMRRPPNQERPLLGIVPLGTANVLAKELGLPSDPKGLVDLFIRGEVRVIGLGRANERYFAQMAGVGFDAHVVANINPAEKRRLRQGAYVLESLRQLGRFAFPPYRMTSAQGERTAFSIVAARGQLYGGPFPLARQAGHDKSDLSFALFGRAGSRAVLRYGLDLLCRRLPENQQLEFISASEALIEGPIGDPVQGDGDIIAHLPVRLTAIPAALRILAPLEGRRA